MLQQNIEKDFFSFIGENQTLILGETSNYQLIYFYAPFYQNIRCDNETVKNCEQLFYYFTQVYDSSPEVKDILDLTAELLTLKPITIAISFEDNKQAKAFYNISTKTIQILSYQEIDINFMGTFVHEISHYVMDQLFENDCYPYHYQSNYFKWLSDFLFVDYLDSSTYRDYLGYDFRYNRTISQIRKNFNDRKVIDEMNLREIKKHVIEDVFRYYEYFQFDREYIARYYQVLSDGKNNELNETVFKPFAEYHNEVIIPAAKNVLGDSEVYTALIPF